MATLYCHVLNSFPKRYISIPIYLITLFGYKWVARTKTVNRFEADLKTGKEEIDRMEIKYLDAKESEVVTRHSKFYKKYISWLL
jgi:amino acid permease